MADQNLSSFLDDDILGDSTVEDGGLLNPRVDNLGLVHSPTTDTLDSVALGPNEDFSGLEDVLSEEDTQEPPAHVTDGTDGGIEIIAKVEEKLDSPKQDTELMLDSYEQRTFSSLDDIFEQTKNNITIESGISGDSGKDQISVESGASGNPNKDQISLSSYFTAGPEQEDPFGDVVKSPSTPFEISQKPTEIKEDVTHVHHDLLETRISQEEPETVDFSVPIEGQTNVMESSMQLIDDKEDFESFTAESGPTELDNDFGLGVSPANKFLTERMSKMQIGEDFTDPSRSDYGRQHSSSSNHSITGFSAPQSSMTPPVVPSPIHQPFQGTPFSASQISPFATPSHQPSTVDPLPDALTITESAPQNCTKDDHLAMPSPPVSTVNVETPFGSVPTGNLEDPFSSSLHMSDSDRQHDAWIPSDSTRQILVTMATSIPGTFNPTVEQLSCPGIIVDEPQGDPVRDLVYRYMGEQEAIKRQILTVDTVTQDVDGLKKLIEGGCYRSAIDLTRRLLSTAGQGPGKVGQITQHTSHTLQLWFTRIVLLMKLRLYSIAESELQAFQNLDTPDLYFEFYPHVYPGRKGSIVPFGLRILHAELPHFMGRSQEALDRLYYILAIVQKIIHNLEQGLSEDGSAVEVPTESRKASIGIWQEREKRIMYIIGNTFLSIRDYEAAMSVYNTLLTKDASHKAALLSGMGRLYLQMGNVSKARDCFQHAEILSDSSDKTILCRNYISRGLESMCLNNFAEAYQNFKLAVDADPTNTSAVNNMAACSLYLGKLMDALKTLEVMVHDNPSRNLHEGVLFNLCTLYELESSRALHKKQALLDLVSRYKGDGFPVACLKMA